MVFDDKTLKQAQEIGISPNKLINFAELVSTLTSGRKEILPQIVSNIKRGLPTLARCKMTLDDMINFPEDCLVSNRGATVADIPEIGGEFLFLYHVYCVKKYREFNRDYEISPEYYARIFSLLTSVSFLDRGKDYLYNGVKTVLITLKKHKIAIEELRFMTEEAVTEIVGEEYQILARVLSAKLNGSDEFDYLS